MADIILNVKLNKEGLDSAKASLKGLTVSKNSVINTDQLQKSYANLFNTIKNSKGSYPDKIFNYVSDSVNKHLQKIKEINKAYHSNNQLTDQQKKIYSQLKKDLDKLSASFATTRAETNKLEKSNKLAIPNINNLRKGFANLLNTIKGTEKNYKKGTFSKIAEDAKKYAEELKTLDKTSPKYAENVNRLDVKLQELQTGFAETRAEATNFHGSLSEIVGGFLKFQIAARLVMIPLQAIKKMWTSINETLTKTEDAVVALQRILNNDNLSNKDISGKMYDLAQKYGQTFENVNDIAQNFARTGMSWNETIKATEAALLALNVAELDATQASDGMIAIMQQFGYEASELTSIIDILNKTADNYAVTTDKLLTALQRTGSSAKNANLSLEETVGLITALSESTGRSGQNLGTAINSLIQYSTKDSALDTFASLDDSTAAVVEKYRKGGADILEVWQAVSQVINNMDSRQEGILAGLANSEDIQNLETELQDELGDIFETVNDVYGTANTFRKNYFIALLGNMQTVEDAIETASNASGYSAKENAKYLDTYTAKTNKLKAQWQELASDEKGLLSIKKLFADIGGGILQLMEWTGGLRTAFLALSTTVWALFGPKILSAVKKLTTGFKTMFIELKAGAISLNSALGIIGLIATAASLIGGIVSTVVESYQTDPTEGINEAAENLDKLQEKVDGITESYNKYLEQLKTSRALLDSETSSEAEKESAQQSLLNMQNALVQSNKDYAESLDLINGNLDTQVEKLKKLEAAEIREAVGEFNRKNATGIANAREYLGKSTSHIKFSERNHLYEWEDSDSIAQWLKDNGYDYVISTNSYDYTNGGSNLSNAFANIGEGIGSFLGGKNLTTGMLLEGTRAQKIAYFEEMLSKVKGDDEYAEYVRGQIQGVIDDLNNETYQNANNLLYGNANSSDWIERLTQEQRKNIANGKLTDEELYKLYNAVANGVDVTETWEEQSAKIVTNYQDLLDVINGIRDAEQNILDIEEKKKALEDARNNKNVRVFNAATGTWELQADEKAIKDAEKAYEDAVWKNLQTEMKDGNLKVKEILDKISDFPKLTSAVVGWLAQQGYNVPDNLLYGTSTSVESTTSGMVTNTNNTTNNNSSYTINGVPISTEQANKYNLPELFEEVANSSN